MVVQAKKRLRDMSLKDIDLRLRKRKRLPDALRVMLVERIKAERKASNSLKIKRDNLRAAWDKVIEPLRKEVESVRVRIAALKRNPHKDYHERYLSVYGEYLEVLKTVRADLTLKRKTANHTPTEFMLAKMGADSAHVKVNKNPDALAFGASWVDWVNYVDAFKYRHVIDELKTKQAGLRYDRRPPEPFFRRDEYQKKKMLAQHNTVLARWKEELNYTLTVMDRTPPTNPQYAGYQKNVALIELAIERLYALPVFKRAPPRWMLMIRQDDFDTLFGKDVGITGADLPASVLDDYEYSEDC